MTLCRMDLTDKSPLFTLSSPKLITVSISILCALRDRDSPLVAYFTMYAFAAPASTRKDESVLIPHPKTKTVCRN